MAYNLLYYYTTTRNGKEISLYIYKRNDTGATAPAAKMIGSLQSLNLEIQGGDNALETAIVKTSLHFAIEDCFDKPDTRQSVTDQSGTHLVNVKHGNWGELYTPDSTLYKVVLREGGVARWSGYLTPDAWEENLTYHSVLNLTARDNLGHLSDIDFDLEDETGLDAFTLEDIVTAAMDRVRLAMDFSFDVDDLKFVNPSGSLVSCASVYFNAEGLKGKTWGKALEEVLDSLGLCLRYVDNNTIAVRTLRSYSIDAAMDRSEKDIRIANNSGHLSKSPALRQISETWTPDADNAITHIAREANDYARIASSSATAWKCSSTSEWADTGSLPVINPFALTDPKHTRSYNPNPEGVLLLQVSPNDTTPGTSSARIERTIKLTGAAFDMGVELSFGIVPCKVIGDYEYMAKSIVGSALTTTLYFTLKGKQSGRVVYFNDSTGDWDSTARVLSISGTYGQSGTSRKIGSTDVTFNADFSAWNLEEVSVILYGFKVTTSDSLIASDKRAGKLFCPITSCIFSQKDVDYPDRVVNTIYNEYYNTQLKRSPEFGELNFDVVNAAVVKNGLYCMASDGSLATMNKWTFSGQEDRKANLPVLIHQEILTFHAKANNVLSGSILDVTADSPHIGDAYVYQGIRYILGGGSLDLFTGMVDNAVLRQYNEYSGLWEILYSVNLTAVGSQKLDVIKAIKEASGISLKEATTLVNSVPSVVYQSYNHDAADKLRETLVALGATATISSE